MAAYHGESLRWAKLVKRHCPSHPSRGAFRPDQTPPLARGSLEMEPPDSQLKRHINEPDELFSD